MAATQEAEPELEMPRTPNVALNRVGSMFLDQSPTVIDSHYYVLGSIGRLCNEVDDITLESSSTRTAATSDSPELGPPSKAPTAYDRDTPVWSWEPRNAMTENTSLEAIVQKRNKIGSSLAPQSSSDTSEGERSEAPSVGQFRPGTDLIQCPVPGCERTFKWKKNLHHHIRDKHPTDAQGLSVMRIQPAVGAAQNGYRLQSIAMAPVLSGAAQVQPGGDPSLQCPECGKTFARKGDLVHHKRYHTRSTDRPYKCDQCGQGFIHHKDLARHMPRHTGQRSFQCPYPECHKNYTRKDNLNRHMRHDHGGLGASGEIWTGVIDPPAPPAIPDQYEEHTMAGAQPGIPMHMPVAPPMAVDQLAAIAEAASNHDLFNGQQVEPPIAPELLAESASSETSNNGVMPNHYPEPPYRETTPSLGKRPATDDLERLATGIKPKRKPKEKWAHRLGCPFRKARSDMFTTENGYRVCETTPHEFIIRLIEHMKRNHELYVCGECFVGFKTPDTLNSHKNSSHHCGKCYLSFPSMERFTDHLDTCRAVEAAKQEDIWQILYETLCCDGVRHNPSFDDESPVEQTIDPNNRIRMQLIAQGTLAPGQVPPLAQQLESPPPAIESGNGTAPPMASTDGTRQQFASAGANRTSSSPVQYRSGSGSPREREAQFAAKYKEQEAKIAMLEYALSIEKQAKQAAEEERDRLASTRVLEVVQTAVRRFVSNVRRRQQIKPNRESGFVEELPGSAEGIDGDGVIAVPSPAPPLPFELSVEDFMSELPALSMGMFSPGFLMPSNIPRTLPSLTSESTLQSLEALMEPPEMSLSPYVAALPYGSSSNDPVQEAPYTWNQPEAGPYYCHICRGMSAPVSGLPCEACQCARIS